MFQNKSCKKMKKSINNLECLLVEAEKLSILQLCHLKGGGEDLRRNTAVIATVSTAIATVIAKI